MTKRIQEWETRLNVAQVGHYAAAERYLRLSAVLGMPLVVLSSFVSAFLFLNQPSALLDVLLRTGGVLVAVLASVQAFVRPAEKAELHRIKATKYGGLKRKVEVFLFQQAPPEEFLRFSKELMTEWDAIAEDSPTTPNRIRKRIKSIIDMDLHRKQQSEQKATAKPQV
jgi:hypothetical protein